MKSIVIEAYGSVDQFKVVEESIPEAKGNDVLVEMKALGINAVDWKIRLGYLKDVVPFKFPLVIGWDISGVVKAVGDQVTAFKVGDEVYAKTDIKRPGGLAEYILVAEKSLLKKPDNLTFEEIASIPLTGLAAWQMLVDLAKVKPGESVLVHGGSGGVGSFSVQLAKYLGAKVTTTTSGKNEAFVRSLGADTVINYEQEDFSQRTGEFDIVLDTLGGKVLEKSYGVLKPGGRLLSLVSQPDEALAKAQNITASYVNVTTKHDELDIIGKLVSEGSIKPVPTTLLPFTLEGVREAHSVSESGHAKGKIVITFK